MKKLTKLLALALAIMTVLALPVQASAANDSTIDFSRTGSVDIYKYDVTNAEKDGVWDSSYVSTGVKDADGVETILGSEEHVSSLNANGEAYGYAIKGVEFSYLKIADIRAYTETENNDNHVELLYGIAPNTQTNALLEVIGLDIHDRVTSADELVGDVSTYYYRSDVLIDGLKNALTANSTTVKNFLESYVRDNGGTALPLTDSYGHTSAAELPLGLYLFVETKVPEMVTDTTAPFLISLPMTSVNGSNTADAGLRWIYDVTLYPKNLTGIPTLDKTVREAKASTGKNAATTATNDGFAHAAIASDGDTLEYQIISTLPSITSKASYLSDYSFVDTLCKGISYKKSDVHIGFYRDTECTDEVASWDKASGKFSVSYGKLDSGEAVMTIAMTAEGLAEINTSAAVYTEAGMVNSGYSDCTLRISYAAVLNSDTSVVYGDGGNRNAVVLTWKRSSTEYYDTLVDDCHVYTYGIDLTKQFSDGKGDYSKVKINLKNLTDGYFIQAKQDETSGVYFVTGFTDKASKATDFIPTGSGKLIVNGLEDDKYTATEVKTDSAYTLLKEPIEIIITQRESDTGCGIYASDTLGLVQNDSRYANVEAGKFHNMPQKQLAHKLLTASATVAGKAVTMTADGSSANALVPLTVINTRGFDLPQTGGYGNWMFPVIGLSLIAVSGAVIYFAMRGKKGRADNK